MWVLGVLACGSEAAVSVLPARADAPVVADVPRVAPAGESRTLELDGGDHAGTRFLFPPGAVGTGTGGVLSDGSIGATFTVEAVGNPVFCTDPMRLGPEAVVRSRYRVAALVPDGDSRAGLDLELRARGADGKPVQRDGRPFLLVAHAVDTGEFLEVEETVSVPEGTVRAELCFRFVHATGTLEVDRVEVETPGTPFVAPAPLVSIRWDLDLPGGGHGAPAGFDFLIPPGTEGAVLSHNGGVVRMEVGAPGNAVACSEHVSVGPGVRARGRYRVLDISGDTGGKSGFVAEVRTFNLVGALVAAGAAAYSTVALAVAPTEWVEFDAPVTPPETGVTGKLCFRFAQATGIAEIDWASLGE